MSAAPRLGDARPNSKYTFETFVIGSSNRFAHTKAYNPLFVYGDSGLSNPQYLLDAIGHYAHTLYSCLTVR